MLHVSRLGARVRVHACALVNEANNAAGVPGAFGHVRDRDHDDYLQPFLPLPLPLRLAGLVVPGDVSFAVNMYMVIVSDHAAMNMCMSIVSYHTVVMSMLNIFQSLAYGYQHVCGCHQ